MSVPKPVLTFVVGVTGHRAARLKDEHLERIAKQLSDVFANIDAECRAEFDRHKHFLGKDPGNKSLYKGSGPSLRLMSSLADGADAMAVRQCPANWTSVGILPCPEQAYIAKLRGGDRHNPDEAAVEAYRVARARSPGDVAILPLSEGRDSHGFGRARSLLLRQIDILVAVWDGHASKNAGGTGDVVEGALEAGIPVIWIAADRAQKPWVISRLEDVRRKTENADATSGPIAEIIRRELDVGERHLRHGGRWELNEVGTSAGSRLKDFLEERVPARHRWMLYDWTRTFPRLWRWRLSKPLPTVTDVREQWTGFISALRDGSAYRSRIDTILLPRFAAADALATYYGHKYRSAYVWAYLLSTLAVAVALSGFLLEHCPGEVPPLKIVFAGVELILVGAIVGIVLRGQWCRWHDKWLDYRALAETLRHLRFLGPLGQYENHAFLEAAARPGAGWMLWYVRATMRELGLPTGDLGADYQHRILSATADHELAPQVQYHFDNMTELRRLHRRLHRMGDISFIATLVVLFFFLAAVCFIDRGWLAHYAPYLTWLTAFLPALGAAYAGIRFTGDFEGFAERSAQTGSELEKLELRYKEALDRLDFDTTASLIFETARIMAADINGWTTLYSRKHLTLPS
jgi:hypothetical protein